ALMQSPGRVLAQSVVADRDLPPFPRAARDGFAVRAADVVTLPVDLNVIAEVRAGMDVSGISIGQGECAEIMTGAVAPQGADAVVMVEYTSRHRDRVEIQRGIASGENIVPQ